MNASSSSSRRQGFTLVEIMTVVLIVGILSSLALFVIGRIQQRAARSLIQNNLRQLYQTKEFYYSESGSGQIISIAGLATRGYLSNQVKERLMNTHSFEGNRGWHYYPVLSAGTPVAAYKGNRPAGSVPQGEIIYYPDQPSSANDVFGTSGAVNTPPPLTQPDAKPPVLIPPAGTSQPNPIAVPPRPVVVNPPPQPVISPPAQQPGVAIPSGQPPPVVNPPKPIAVPSISVTVTPTQQPIVAPPALQTGGGPQPQVIAVPSIPVVVTPPQPTVVTPTTQPVTSGIKFDDNLNAYVVNDHPLQTRAALKAVSFEVEFRGGPQVPAVGSHSATILSYAGGNGNLDEFSLRNPESLSVTFKGQTINTNLNVNDGQPHRLTATWVSISGEFLLYDNGQQVWRGEFNRGQTLSGRGTLVLGQNQASRLPGGRFNSIDAFQGEIFSASMASEDLSATEVQSGRMGTQLNKNGGLITDIQITPSGVIDATGQHSYSARGSALTSP